MRVRFAMYFKALCSILGFTLECFLSPLLEGEVIIVEFSKNSPYLKGNKSFKAKAIGHAQLAKKGSKIAGQLILAVVPPVFRGGELVYIRDGKRKLWHYILGKENFPVRVIFVCKKKCVVDDSKKIVAET